MHKFRCLFCETELTADDYMIGSCVNCPSCGEVVVISDKLFPAGSEFEGYLIKDMLVSSTMSTIYSAVGVKKLSGQNVLVTVPSSFARKQLGERFSTFNNYVKKVGYLSVDELPEMVDGVLNLDNPYYVYSAHSEPVLLSSLNVASVFSEPYDALKVVRKLVIFLKRLHTEYAMVVQALKPEMISYYPNGKVHVLNLGLSQFILSNPDLLQLGLDIWHPVFASPEFLSTGAADSVSTDIFSLGGILYYMLTGQDPVAGEVYSCGDDLRNLNRDIPEAIINLFEKMYAPDISSRYSSYVQLLRDIDASLKQSQGTIKGAEDSSYHETSTMAFDMQSVLDDIKQDGGTGISFDDDDDEEEESYVQSTQHPLSRKKLEEITGESENKGGPKLGIIVVAVVALVVLAALAYFFMM